MSVTIDFLPQKYRRQRQIRQARTWWMLVMVMLVAVTCSASLAQWNIRRCVENDIAAVLPQREQVMAQEAQLAQLQKELQGARELASLYTFLEHPWPRSSVLAAIAEPIPDTLRIQTIAFRSESRPKLDEEVIAPRSRKEKTKAPKIAAAQADLAKLHEHASSLDHVVHLSGETQDIAMLHRFVDELARHPLIQSASLKSLGASDSSKSADTLASFDVVLQLAPAYGMPGGPHESLKRDREMALQSLVPAIARAARSAAR
ncbi:Fimbrial assembly family protein [Pirellula staleyi DSM 6068]|uniref:Fimbrial assembly family protein n=1 Tax=Pirellula staleyi (strain ATCC 27377 / DSM 6068 / ICPB 4128) TaxID=530564 RepID=D2QZA0_PIRSD|nr:hypothetical protein [Pirellula staleyi]ADB18292.1 Fimbrial assembly family protein [Pirellula staleyi DSM 6068]